MPRGRISYVPEAIRGRSVCLGREIPVRADDVPYDARRPGTRVRFDLVWEDDDLRASTVRRTGATRTRGRRSPADRLPRVPSGTGPSALAFGSGGDSVESGSER